MKKLALLLFGVLAAICARAGQVATESAWCWFADPRAMHYETPAGRINATYLGYIDTHGNIRAMQYDFNAQKADEVLIRSYFQPDDHNNPTFLALPDGRIMVFYSRHTDEPCFYYRISQERGDITTLGPEHVLATSANTTYPSPFILSSDPDHIYLCWRGIGWHPTIARLSMPDANGNVEFVGGPYQMVQSTGARPYAKYYSNGKDKIYVAYTTGHPDNESPNYLYFNIVDIPSLTLTDIDGNKLSNIADGPFAVNKSKEYLEKYPATVVDASPYRDWLSQVGQDRNGNPIIAMTRISDDKKSHNYYVATRANGAWRLSKVAHGGGHFHQTPNIEKCYSGGMTLDPLDPNAVYCSVPVDGAHGRVYEIVRYQLDSNGEVVSTRAITKNSEKNNFRPFAIAGTAESPLKLGWMQGDYYDWIVSQERPLGYGACVMTDFDGFESIPYGPMPAPRQTSAQLPEKFTLAADFCAPVAYEYTEGKDFVVDLGDLKYRVDATTLIPEIRYKKKVYPSTNMLATSDAWATMPRGTNGKWYTPTPYEKAEITLDYTDGVVTTYINGMLDQRVRIAPSAQKAQVFEVEKPDFKLSPYTGMTRKHWIQAGEYLLAGAFNKINSLDDDMYFQRQLDKTYPRNDGGIQVAKLEGLARTFFLAAPLLRDNPDLTLNGIKVADYYRHQILKLPQELPAKPGGPSQTLLELGSICMSLKVAPDAVWNTFTQDEKDRVAALMKAYGEGPTIGSNWRFFNVFILSFLKDQGYDINDEYLKFNITELLDRYRGEGWYNDAPAYDYYSMWAFQTYGPLWAELFGRKQYPELADQFFKNQGDMIDNYPYMFNRDGKMNMWGRSLPYRFACVAPLPMIEYGNHEGVNYGWLRRIASSTLLQFMQNPDFLEDGIPVMGYYGVFAPCVQIYSCRGSVYWLGKAFFSLMLPEDSDYWTATENNGAWDTELKPGNVYNKFQPATNLMITDYPDCGGSEMRSWCKEKVSNDWQKFRSTENYNRLAYHTEFPWMADGPDGEVAMNYATTNRHGSWEVLRLYDFKSFENGQYRRDAVLESDENARYQLTDIPLPGGVLRVDKVSLPAETDVRLGSYSLPEVGGKLASAQRGKATTITNGEYSLAVVPLAGWDKVDAKFPYGLHPVSDKCGLIQTEARAKDQIFVTLQLWKKGPKAFTASELGQVKSVDVAPDLSSATITMANGTVHTVLFD